MFFWVLTVFLIFTCSNLHEQVCVLDWWTNSYLHTHKYHCWRGQEINYSNISGLKNASKDGYKHAHIGAGLESGPFVVIKTLTQPPERLVNCSGPAFTNILEINAFPVWPPAAHRWLNSSQIFSPFWFLNCNSGDLFLMLKIRVSAHM